MTFDQLPSFEEFVWNTNRSPSTEFSDATHDILEHLGNHEGLGESIADHLAAINDVWFLSKSSDSDTLDRVEALLIAGLKEAGYELEFSDEQMPSKE
jgi:hypothetical protein